MAQIYFHSTLPSLTKSNRNYKLGDIVFQLQTNNLESGNWIILSCIAFAPENVEFLLYPLLYLSRYDILRSYLFIMPLFHEKEIRTFLPRSFLFGEISILSFLEFILKHSALLCQYFQTLFRNADLFSHILRHLIIGEEFLCQYIRI